MSQDKKTPLYDRHEALGAKIVSFGGYLLPVQYGTGIIEEHMAVRTAAGLFDVSHMGQIFVSGQNALAALNDLLTNRFDSLAVGRARYSPLCDEAGGMIDDLLVYRTDEREYMLVVNAANKDKDLAFIKAHALPGVTIRDASDQTALIALQGPLSEGILKTVADGALPEAYYSFVSGLPLFGVSCLISRTGYTGEDGFEIYCRPEATPAIWDGLLLAGQEAGLIPCGLGARDTLRLEASLPLYGHEMDENTSPLEAGLSAFVKMDKDDFIGKKALLTRGEPRSKRVGIKVTGRGIAREHCPIYAGDRLIGETTSGTHLPFLGGAYAMARVQVDEAAIGTTVFLEVRGRKIAGEIVPLPFYKRT